MNCLNNTSQILIVFLINGISNVYLDHHDINLKYLFYISPVFDSYVLLPCPYIILFLTSNEVTITMNNSETGKEAERTPYPPLWALSSDGAGVLIHQ